MKKLFAIMLALMLVLTMGSALAEEVTEPTIGYVENGGTFKITKTYSGVGYPGGEELTFKVVGAPEVSISKATIGSGSTSAELTVSLPKYEVPGVYEYTISEEPNGAIAGVTYAGTYKLKVTVYYNSEGELVCQPALRLGGDGPKTDEIVNTYNSGTLKVTKQVEGQFGDKTKGFEITVTFKMPKGSEATPKSTILYRLGDADQPQQATFVDGVCKVTINLSDDGYATFSNIPYGVEYTVEETDASVVGVYDVTYQNETGVVNAPSYEATVTNTSKDGTIDTGITTDNLPYIVLMGIVVLAGVAMIAKRRMAHND